MVRLQAEVDAFRGDRDPVTDPSTDGGSVPGALRLAAIRGDLGPAQAIGPLSLKYTFTVMITGVGTPFSSVGV